MKLSLRYFASLRESMGISSETVDTQVATLGALRDELIARGGASADALGRGRVVRAALNQTMCDESTELVDGAEIGFFPPVTGG
ncbi:MoaD/ThiS family protein [Hydrogenophaga sp. PAMC20947]|uniref:MoaD/ThiS family protein n=1 Tax=Hydrogenophaga sp. PAMC20947 TaxID=2565558 RepID=UPI00109E196D|nr:MoaD/ThiS family protein [Hydrogenophaga sp. PAMC20947]QCB45800.1 MoaD/ThiS family protein [Hydrogenophaga sp. PAMC20947]